MNLGLLEVAAIRGAVVLRRVGRFLKPGGVSPGGRRRSVLVLVDIHDHRRGGHFGPWLFWFATEFRKRFDEVVVVTPEPASTRQLFRDLGNDAPDGFGFRRCPRFLRRRFDLDPLLDFLSIKGAKTACFIMWGYDLWDCKKVLASSYPWGMLIGISWLHRGHTAGSAEKERRLTALADDDDSCMAFFQPDRFLDDRCSKSVWVTDVESVRTVPGSTVLLDRIREFGEGRLCIGVFGMLHGYRCLNEFLRLARQQPRVRFVVVGRVFLESVSEELRPDLGSRTPGNLLVHGRFVEDEEELNAAINLVDGLFIDGSSYPVQSGIVCKALHFGKWVVSRAGNSWTTDVIGEAGVGFVYERPDIDLTAEWENWKNGGGEDRSREYSMKLRHPGTIARCFDTMAHRLRGGVRIDQ